MPLRLWAGVWMPMAQNASHHGPDSVNVTQQTKADAAHDCHEAMAESAHGANAQPHTALDTNMQQADCHDGTCQLCGVCHQSASLPAWPLLIAVSQLHSVPVCVSLTHVALTAPPLTKPPIS